MNNALRKRTSKVFATLAILGTAAAVAVLVIGFRG